MEDKQWWHGKEVDTVTVQHIYRSLKVSPSTDDESSWRWIWRIVVRPKIQTWIWKLLHHMLPTEATLIARSLNVNSRCGRGVVDDETNGHLIWDCLKSRECWWLTWPKLHIARTSNNYIGWC